MATRRVLGSQAATFEKGASMLETGNVVLARERLTDVARELHADRPAERIEAADLAIRRS